MTTTSTDAPEAPIDPRMRARRREVRRREGRRRLRRLGAVAAMAGLVAAGALVTLSPVLDVDRVEVRGAVRTGIEEVQRAAGIDLGEPMVTLVGGSAEKGVEALPWVARATMVRSWPAKVIITVEERVAAAIARAGDGRRVLIDAEGRQLVVVAADDGAVDLPVLQGPPFDATPGSMVGHWASGAIELARRLGAGFDDVVVTVVDGALEARVSGAGVKDLLVRFGTPDRLESKVLALASVLAGAEPEPPPVVVDVRAPGAPSLTRAAPGPYALDRNKRFT